MFTSMKMRNPGGKTAKSQFLCFSTKICRKVDLHYVNYIVKEMGPAPALQESSSDLFTSDIINLIN